MKDLKKTLTGLSLITVIVVAVLGGAVADRLFGVRPLDYFFPRLVDETGQRITEREVVKEESLVIKAIEKASPSVVTISVNTPKKRVLEFDPFGGFGVREQGGQQDLATGFIVSQDGLLVTNKHVVANSGLKYTAITKDGEEYEVKNIYRDPANDLALLKVEAAGLPAIELGDSDSLQVGQTVIAIGTPLGEFRQSATSGIISGLGRGIQAGNPFEGYVERLDNIIQTDAAINPGNSGGPLLDSSAKVIGINVAVAAGAQNIGFAIPVNVVRSSIDQFKQTGEFVRPFLGVQYQMISRDAALANELPEGAYVRDVVSGSPAEKAGVKVGDIITRFGQEKIEADKGGLAQLVNKHKVGDVVQIEVWRDGKLEVLSVALRKAE